MKRPLTLLTLLAILVSLAACGEDPAARAAPDTPGDGQQPEDAADAPAAAEQGAPPPSPGEGGSGQAQEEETTMEETRRIRFSLDDGSEIIVRLNGNPAAEALWDMLPLELTFEEFNGTEKIAYLPEELSIDGAPDSCDPEAGSLCYYIPWGNLCFFYQDFRASSSLVPLGQVESGAEFLERLDLAAGITAEAGL